MTPSTVTVYNAPARVAPSLQASSGLVNPQFSTTREEVSAPKVIGSLLFALAGQIHQDTNRCWRNDPEHRRQVTPQRIPEVQFIERTQEQIEVLIGDIPVPPFVEDTAEVVKVIPHDRLGPREFFPEYFYERTVDLPVPPIVRGILEVMLPSRSATHATREQDAERIVNIPIPQGAVVPVIDQVSTSHERENPPSKVLIHTIVQTRLSRRQLEVCSKTSSRKATSG